MGRRRYTRVCKVRGAQCVCIALTGSKSQTSRKQTPFSALGCEAPSAPGAFGVYVCLRALSASGYGACGVLRCLMSEARFSSEARGASAVCLVSKALMASRGAFGV